MNHRHQQAACVAAICFALCLGIVLLAFAQHAFFTVAPAIRETLFRLLTPEFGTGMVFAFACVAIFVTAAWWDNH